MTAKSLSKRLERLEARSLESSTPLVLVVNFVDADHRVVSQIELRGGSAAAVAGSPDAGGFPASARVNV
jgi:hypothetical protein